MDLDHTFYAINEATARYKGIMKTNLVVANYYDARYKAVESAEAFTQQDKEIIHTLPLKSNSGGTML